MNLPPERDAALLKRARRSLYVVATLLVFGTGCAHFWIGWVSGARASMEILPSTAMNYMGPAALYAAGGVLLTGSRIWAAVLEWLCALHGIVTAVFTLMGLLAVGLGFDLLAGVALIAGYLVLTLMLVRLTFLLEEVRTNHRMGMADPQRGFEPVLAQPVESLPDRPIERDTGIDR